MCWVVKGLEPDYWRAWVPTTAQRHKATPAPRVSAHLCWAKMWKHHVPKGSALTRHCPYEQHDARQTNGLQADNSQEQDSARSGPAAYANC
mmetsp:Transcript_53913/g.101138  ORF Transcript_53913/g.101138 Transcript_53913/m.101138 type:complete len:91 (+) Transcript_53913:630-902(+)